ncbi:LapA family protein [Burkholderiaceae bacterium DAT-1]|nr:LapA family protein [Burkholderiaceae bacterium DAT-1]
MRYLSALFKVTIFLVLFGFAMRNVGIVEVTGLLGGVATAPLAVVLFLAFLLGAGAGVLAMTTHMARMRKEIGELRRQLRTHTERADPVAVEVSDIDHPLDAVV